MKFTTILIIASFILIGSCVRTRVEYVVPEDCKPWIEKNEQLQEDYDELLDRYEILIDECE